MFCSECGNPAPAKASFCPNCGTALTTAQFSQAQPDSATDPATPAGYYFTTSTLKLVLMSTCTLGIYELFWFYKNWVLIKARTGQNLMPFWRAFFAPIWAYGCFNHIRTSAQENNFQESLPAGFLAIVFFIIQALWRLPDPYWLVSFLSVVPIIPANKLAISLNKGLVPGFRNNDNFTGWNWAGLILGGILLILAVIGLFVPLENE